MCILGMGSSLFWWGGGPNLKINYDTISKFTQVSAKTCPSPHPLVPAFIQTSKIVEFLTDTLPKGRVGISSRLATNGGHGVFCPHLIMDNVHKRFILRS